MDLYEKIRDVPDFPKPGIVFKDITPLLNDKGAFRYAIFEMRRLVAGKEIDKVVGIESRGFIIGSVLAHELGVGFVPVRKKGKLPAATVRQEYALEYGTDAVEMHKDAISSGEKVLIVDDLLATGGTSAATASLVEMLGGKIAGFCFLVELNFLRGREKLAGYDVRSLLHYESE